MDHDRDVRDHVARLDERIVALDRILESKIILQRAYLDSQAAQVRIALEASERAVHKAEAANERRFEAVNEFRRALSDQTQSFITREVYESAHSALRKRIDDIHTSQTRMIGIAVGMSTAVTIIGVLTSNLLRLIA